LRFLLFFGKKQNVNRNRKKRTDPQKENPKHEPQQTSIHCTARWLLLLVADETRSYIKP
jgi:hypothetical protein